MINDRTPWLQLFLTCVCVRVCVFSESFIEVSEDDSKEEDAGESLATAGGKTYPDEVREDEAKEEEKSEECLTAPLNSEEETDTKTQSETIEETEADSRSAPAISEWEHFDVVGFL